MAVHYHTDDCRYRLPEKRRTSAWLKEVAASEGYRLGEVNYIFCSARRLLEMNRQFLGHDYYTDIITFDYSDLKGEGIIHGDIYIDVETVADNARQYGATRLEEMRRVWCTVCCTCAVRKIRRHVPMHRCTEKRINT